MFDSVYIIDVVRLYENVGERVEKRKFSNINRMINGSTNDV